MDTARKSSGGKTVSMAQDSYRPQGLPFQRQRQPMTCSRCKALMYPKARGAAENHKPGFCSDGAPVKLKSGQVPRWPQPQGVFTAGTQLHVLPFFKAAQDLLQRVEVDIESRTDLDMELEAFATIFEERVQYDQTEAGMALFELLDGVTVQNATSFRPYLLEMGGKQYLRLDCLRDT